MKARIIERKWVQAWFDERQCNHMPSLTLGYDGTLLATWYGGMMEFNGDPMGRDSTIWLSRLERGAEEWSNPEGVGTDMRYCCHDNCFVKNSRGDIFLVYSKWLDTAGNVKTWCNGRDKLWMTKSRDGGLTWLPAKETNIPLIGIPSNDGILLPDGDMLMAVTSAEDPDFYYGSVRILRSTDDGETWEMESLLKVDDGTKIREPVLVLRPDGSIHIYTRTCPANLGWGGPGIEQTIYAYTCRSFDNGKTWTKPKPSTITNNESKIDVINWTDGSLLMAYDYTTNLDWHERSPLWLARSTDDGATWENILELEPGPGVKAQPAMCVDTDGRLNVVYMHRHTAVEHIVVQIRE